MAQGWFIMEREYDFDPWTTLVDLDAEMTVGSVVEPEAEREIDRLWTKPLGRFQPKDLDLMIRHGAGLAQLVPLALDRLQNDSLLSSGRHPGDLLTSLLEAAPSFWRENRPLWEETLDVVADALEKISAGMEDEETIQNKIGDDFAAALVFFRGLHEAEAPE